LASISPHGPPPTISTEHLFGEASANIAARDVVLRLAAFAVRALAACQGGWASVCKFSRLN
jgi:hypothetical protein